MVSMLNPDDSIRSIQEHQGGEMTGMFALYHDNGQVQITGSMLQGQLDGPVTSVSNTGNKTATQTYTRGVLNGISIYYNPDGSKSRTDIYQDGVIQGISTIYIDNKKACLMEYKADEFTGRYQSFLKDTSIEACFGN
jgi:antitoxin component YwqK of YwqJK toxin-antitoxin module